MYPRKRDHTKGFLDAVVGDAKRQVENQRVEEEISAGNIESDLRKALEVGFQRYRISHHVEAEFSY